MAAGDYAASQGYTINAGTQDANKIHLFINAALDYLAYKTGAQGAAVPISLGGTGATAAPAARTALGIPTILGPDATVAGGIPTYSSALTIAVGAPTQPYHATTKAYVDAAVGGGSYLPLSGGTISGDLGVTGNIYTPGSSIATSGWTNSYINADGRICRGASSARFKKNIDRAPVVAGFGELVTSYEMRKDPDAVTRFGPIVEDMVKAGGAVAALVNYDDQGRPESFDQISFLMACIAELRAEIAELRNGS